MACTVIPALWEAEVGESPEVRSSRPAWPKVVKPYPYQKYKNYPAMVMHTCNPIYSGGEAGELLEPGRRMLQ